MEARDSGVRYSREECAFETRDSIRGKIDHENGGGPGGQECSVILARPSRVVGRRDGARSQLVMHQQGDAGSHQIANQEKVLTLVLQLSRLLQHPCCRPSILACQNPAL